LMKRVAQRPELQQCAARSPETASRRRWFWSFPSRTEHFTRHYQSILPATTKE
jgi:hypothetical protein